MLEINLLGPLCVEINLKVQMGACLVGDAHLANYKGLTFGGPLLKIARLLSTLGHSWKLWNYLGNDEFGNKIIENIKQEKIEANIQIIPNAPTPIICKLSDKKDYSSYTTQIKDLSLWEFRIKNLKDSGVIFIDPAIPTEIQLEIIKKTKKAILLLKKPLDGKLDIFYQPKNLIILLNEYEIFQIFAQTEYKHFDPSRMLTHKILHNHNILLESKYNITTLDNEREIIEIPLKKIRNNHFLLNEYYITGILTALASQHNYMEAFKWGMVSALEYEKNIPLNKSDILSKIKNFSWIPYNNEKIQTI